MAVETVAARFGSGQAVRRTEDSNFVTGHGRYADNATLPGEVHMYFLRSPYPHAKIVSIDTSAAGSMPGVLGIFTGDDLVKAGVEPIPGTPAFRRIDGSPAASPPQHVLAVGTVRFVGEGVAAVVAETRAQARDAAEAIAVEYDSLPAVVTAGVAAADGAPQVWADAAGNICAEMHHGDKAAADAAFASAAHVVSLNIINQRLAASPMEPRAVLATYDEAAEKYTLRMSNQTPTGARNTLADGVLKIPQDKVRIVVGDIGGGFGNKAGLYPEDAVAAVAAKQLKKPVKWCAERGEELLAASHGRDVESEASLALDANGKVLCLRVHSLAGLGAYGTGVGIAIQLLIGPWVSTSIYDIKTIDIRIKGVLTNTSPTGAYRGAGRPEAIYTIERLMDAAARKIGLDPSEVRRRNLVSPSQMPYTNAMGQTYDSGKFEQVLDQALKLADWSGFDARLAQSTRSGKLRGRGLASFLEWTGGNVFEERVTVAVTGDGEIEIVSATQGMGQGIATSYAQLAVDVFGVPIEKIKIIQGDTDRTTGFGSVGSRSLFTGGSAVRVAAEKTVTMAQELASNELEASVGDIEYVAGEFTVAGTDRKIGLFELAGKQAERRIYIDSTSSVSGPTWPNGAHIAEVEIEPDTGLVKIVKYSSVNDVGRAVNPMIVKGQLDGGAMQGIGQALMEEVFYDPESGQAITASFMDYAMPRADTVRVFATELDQSTPCLTNPLGVKGVGELGTIGATPAVVNAVMDALVRGGVATEHVLKLNMPLTSPKVWRALQAK